MGSGPKRADKMAETNDFRKAVQIAMKNSTCECSPSWRELVNLLRRFNELEGGMTGVPKSFSEDVRAAIARAEGN